MIISFWHLILWRYIPASSSCTLHPAPVLSASGQASALNHSNSYVQWSGDRLVRTGGDSRSPKQSRKSCTSYGLRLMAWKLGPTLSNTHSLCKASGLGSMHKKTKIQRNPVCIPGECTTPYVNTFLWCKSPPLPPPSITTRSSVLPGWHLINTMLA